jgi:hypothetical protein
MGIYLNIKSNSYLIIISERRSYLMESEQEVQNAREKLAARFGNATQIGGKGKPQSFLPPHSLETALN